MNARWVKNRPSLQLPMVVQSLVVSFWPWKYYLVTTYQDKNDSPESDLINKLRELNIEVAPGPRYLTLVSRCNKNMIPKDGNSLVYEKEYTNLNEAQRSHEEVVKSLAAGRLKFNVSFKLPIQDLPLSI